MKRITSVIVACVLTLGATVLSVECQAQTNQVTQVPGIATDTASGASIGLLGGAKAPPTPAQLEEMYVDAWYKLGERYVDPSKLTHWGDWVGKYHGKLKTEQDLDAALLAMAESLGDTWTGYESSHQKLLQVFAAVRGLVDLGMVLKVDAASGEYHVKIAPFGSIARDNGLQTGDVIKSVNGKTLKGLSSAAVEELLSVPVTSAVTVVYRPADAVQSSDDTTLSFKAVPSAAPLAEARMLKNGVLYARLSSFRDGPEDVGIFYNAVTKTLAECNCSPRGMILDLRGNPGGKFELVLKMAAFFLPGQVVVSSTTREGNLETSSTYRAQPLTAFEAAPLSVGQLKMIKLFSTAAIVTLVDGSTASAAEVFTGALKDNKRALIVGVRTFGKGVGFDQIDVPLGGELTITTLKYTTPGGFDVSTGGITPDVGVTQPRSKTAGDVQLTEGLKLLEKRIADASGSTPH